MCFCEGFKLSNACTSKGGQTAAEAGDMEGRPQKYYSIMLQHRDHLDEILKRMAGGTGKQLLLEVLHLFTSCRTPFYLRAGRPGLPSDLAGGKLDTFALDWVREGEPCR